MKEVAGTTGDAGGFAERLLEVIDSGRRTATYKLALLLTLIDLCGRQSDASGKAPSVLYTRDIAEAVAALYWPQVTEYAPPGSQESVDLRQITATRSTIIAAVSNYRMRAEATGATSLYIARLRLPRDYESMIDRVEVGVAEQPLPRLQTVGSSEVSYPFLYDLEWGARHSVSTARLRRSGSRGAPVHLRPGAGDHLIRLAPLLRPLIELHWTRMVANLNGIARVEADLHRHLFGSERILPPKELRAALLDMQNGCCFYCDLDMDKGEADHFIPRVRCGIDAIENLVMAHAACNRDKRDLLPAPHFVSAWADRNVSHASELQRLASGHGWETSGRAVLAVARSIYGHLPGGPAPFWAGIKEIAMIDSRLGVLAAVG